MTDVCHKQVSDVRNPTLVASEQLELDPYKLDIIDVKKMPPTRKRDAPTRYRIRFGDIFSRTSFYKARTRPSCKIWMNEDLCQPRAKLAYQARQVVFHKKAVRTWTYLGKIFIIYTENAAPTLINRFEELPTIENAPTETQPKRTNHLSHTIVVLDILEYHINSIL